MVVTQMSLVQCLDDVVIYGKPHVSLVKYYNFNSTDERVPPWIKNLTVNLEVHGSITD